MTKVDINSNSIVTVEYLVKKINDEIVFHSFDLEDVSYIKCEQIIDFFITIILKSGTLMKFNVSDIEQYKRIFSRWTTVKQQNKRNKK